jgi:NADH-quinone oxidoreductase subunit G
MLSGALKATFLFNNEPEFDSAAGRASIAALKQCEMVVTLSPFKANLEMSDVLLPISPFTETPGTFVNAEGRMQSFYAVAKPLGDTRPAWKVFRALADILNLPGFAFDSAQEVLLHLQANLGGSVPNWIPANRLSNVNELSEAGAPMQGEPCVAAIYQLDSIVRRATALQLTADAKKAGTQEVTT